MQIHISPRDVKLTSAIHAYVAQKIESLEHFGLNLIGAHVAVWHDDKRAFKHAFVVKVHLALPGPDIHAEDHGHDLYQAIDVVATYKKYHDQGFEIVGVSLDQDKSALLAFTKENGMVWPQIFDGKGWDSQVSSSFGISEIPTMWLVGKDGKVLTTNAREDLGGQVAKALAAP